MKHIIKSAVICAGLLPALASAQSVDRTKYPDYNPNTNPDFSLLKNSLGSSHKISRGAEANELPVRVNNAETKYFPPVFNQDGGSCGSASRICYMFTHEINAFRDADAKLLTNRYPSHFVWLLTNGHSGKDEFVQFVGVPNAEVYGGTTYSALFGNQDTSQDHFGWMQGYDKWYSAMWNRMLRPSNFPLSVQSEEGREAVKRWLYNHNGDTDFHAGGIVGIGVASGGDWKFIPKTPTNDNIGVTGKYYVNAWGQQVDHALTVVGYDDRIEFDLDGNGVKGEKDKDEVGAWIVVNSWGDGWCNNGFIYCPYKYAGPVGKAQGGYWAPEIYKVRKNYRPLRTIKIKMEYTRRSEIYLSAGVSTNLNATKPEQSVAFEHFKFAGDGNNGNSNPAPEVPMLGRWADGKLHYEPMEFGYDLTDLSAGYDKNQPLKYFFIVETRSWAEGEGKIHNASIIDYEFDKEGIETPFNLNGAPVEIHNKGGKTIISTVVYGETYFAPRNLALQENTLNWNAPLRSSHKISNYNIYRNGSVLAKIDATQNAYTLTEVEPNTSYSLSAVYENGTESSKISVSTPVTNAAVNQVVNFKHSGFSIPNVFNSKFEEATIEYWLRPHTVENWNQSAGPGWGSFMLHANSNGAFTAGWNVNGHRVETVANKLKVGQWNHIAIVVKKNLFKVYINGQKSGSISSDTYSGIGGFGNLVFNPNGDQNNTNGMIDELRIWDYAKTDSEVFKNKNVQYSGELMPSGLVAYYKGDVVEVNGKQMLHEYVAGNHAEILNSNFVQTTNTALKLNNSNERLSIRINKPSIEIYSGLPVNFSAKYSSSATKIAWNTDNGEAKNMNVINPTFIFNKLGEQHVSVTAENAEGDVVSDTCLINVLDNPAPDASFTSTKDKISVGERVTFIVTNPMFGYLYEWSMPGADIESSQSTNAATSYSLNGDYKITLNVTAPNGKKSTSTMDIKVEEVAPIADFDVAPTIIMKGETTFLKDKSKYSPKQWQWLLHSANKDVVINGQNSSYTPQETGVYDIQLKATNNVGSTSKTRQRALIVCNADSKNGLNFSHNNAQVKLTKDPFKANSHQATLDFWMKPFNLTSVCCGFGQDGKMSLRATTDGSITLFMGDGKYGTRPNYISANEWHHYAITFENGNIKFYRDGFLFDSEKGAPTTLPKFDEFHISSPDAPINGQLDEFRIWNTALTQNEIQSYANQPLENIEQAVKDNDLLVYYNFNQNGGDVKDLTGNENHGIRTQFGPDGDAWGLSKGVFCLNFGKSATKNVTAQYLKNYKKAFKRDGNKVVNPAQKPRFGAIADWTLENATVEGNVTTCVHVDNQKESCFTFTSGWDGFGSLNNHKAYQTVTLPAGSYTFNANYGRFESSCGNSFMVVAVGKGIPATLELKENALAYTPMNSGGTKSVNSVSFVLTEETEVSLGLLINLPGRQCCTIAEFELLHSDIEMLEADNSNGYDLTIDGTGYNTLYLPYPTIVPENVKAFTAKSIEGNIVQLEAISNGVVPANTGVIVVAEAGKYHFVPSATASNASSILYGVLTNTEVDSSKRYYSLDAQDEPGFYLYNGSTLEANRAYIVTESTDTNDAYKLDLVAVGIDNVNADKTPAKIYDLSGRRVNEPNKGVYILNGKKVLVK